MSERRQEMLKPTKPIETYKKYGFKKCKGEYGKNHCYYLCVSRGSQMIFLSPSMITINPWTDDDPRIHKNANCRYKDCRTALDIVCEMATHELIKVEYF